jgi:hypothetical protein
VPCPPVPCPRLLDRYQDPLKRSSEEEPSARASLRPVQGAADFTKTPQGVGKGGECIVEGLTAYVAAAGCSGTGMLSEDFSLAIFIGALLG